MDQSQKNALAVCKALEELKVHMSQIIDLPRFPDRPPFSDFTFPDCELPATQLKDTRCPNLPRTEMYDRVVDLIHTLERGHHLCRRSCEERRQTIRSHLEDSKSSFYSLTLALAQQLSVKESQIEDVRRLKEELVDTKRRLGKFRRIIDGYRQFAFDRFEKMRKDPTKEGRARTDELAYLNQGMMAINEIVKEEQDVFGTRR